jgi:hypothetical protein
VHAYNDVASSRLAISIYLVADLSAWYTSSLGPLCQAKQAVGSFPFFYLQHTRHISEPLPVPHLIRQRYLIPSTYLYTPLSSRLAENILQAEPVDKGN